MKTSKCARDQLTIVRNKLVAGEGTPTAVAGTKRKAHKCIYSAEIIHEIT